MNSMTLQQLKTIKRDFDAFSSVIGKSPEAAALILQKLIGKTKIFSTVLKPEAAERKYAGIEGEISCLKNALALTSVTSFLKAAEALRTVKMEHGPIIEPIRANVDIVESGLREIVHNRAASANDLNRRLMDLEVDRNEARFAIAASAYVEKISSKINELAATEAGREKRVLRDLASILSEFTQHLREHGDSKTAEGLKTLSVFVRKSTNPSPATAKANPKAKGAKA